jgi:beta-galactosidase
MFDYNTHQDFGSGDRICYHGVLDPFRNPKLAAYAYAAEGLEEPVLAVSSTMDIGEHPGGSIPDLYVFTNADEVELYKNDTFIAAFHGSTEYPTMRCGPIRIDDRIGRQLELQEGFDPKTAAVAAECLNAVARYGFAALPKKYLVKLAAVMLKTGMTYEDGVRLYGKYVAGWGDKSTIWHFVAKRGGAEVARVSRGPVQSTALRAKADATFLSEKGTWDMATVRFQAEAQYGNVLPYCSRPVLLRVSGPLEIVGPRIVSLSGGMGGTYLRTTGKPGHAVLTLLCDGMEEISLNFHIEVLED